MSVDKYDEAIAYLTANPTEIRRAWLGGYVDDHPAACLFQAAGGPQLGECGCLTAIRANSDTLAATVELTREIRRDKRIPKFSRDITLETLPVFAEWQRRIDAMGLR